MNRFRIRLGFGIGVLAGLGVESYLKDTGRFEWDSAILEDTLDFCTIGRRCTK